VKDTIQCALDLVDSLRCDLATLETKFMLKCSDLTEKTTLLETHQIDVKNLRNDLVLSRELHAKKNAEIRDLKAKELGMQDGVDDLHVTIDGMQEKIDKHEGLRHTLTVDKKLLEVHVISLEQSIRVYRRREADLNETKATIANIDENTLEKEKG